jgi:hypothetical protein
MDKTGGGIRILMKLARDHISECAEVRNINIKFSRIFFPTKSREHILTLYICESCTSKIVLCKKVFRFSHAGTWKLPLFPFYLSLFISIHYLPMYVCDICMKHTKLEYFTLVDKVNHTHST